MPLEALRWPVTPLGLHYLLVHYDIPLVDPDAWRLEVGGRVARPLSLSLDELRARPAVELTVTMECAGNGRAKLDPRPFSQPWLVEAVGRPAGAASRSRRSSTRRSRSATPSTSRSPVSTAGSRAGSSSGTRARCRSPRRSPRTRVLAYEMNGVPLPPQHGFPLRLVVPGLVRDDERQVARADRRARPSLRRLPAGHGVPAARRARTRRGRR